MANGIKYQAHEILNKVLNTAETGLQVDIVAGAEYAEDAALTSEDTGNFILGVRNDTLAALGGTDGDYVPFQMNASGALFVEVASSSGDDSIYVDDADWSDGSSKHTLVGGLYQSSPQSITDGDTGPLQVNANGNLIVDLSATDNAVLDAMVVDLAAMETLLTAANVDHAANEALLITIDEDTNAIKGHVDGIETLITSTNSKIDTFDAVLDNILTKNTEIDAVLDTIKTDTGTIDSDTDATKNALNNMLYGTALAVTAVHGGSDHSLGATYEAFHIGVGGDISLDCVTSGTNIVFKNVASGQMLPVRATVVNATNTTATNIVALKA